MGQAKTHITSPYGYRTHPVTGARGSWHNGVDFRAQMGTPVFACEDAEIVQVQRNVSSNSKLQGSGIFVLYDTKDLRISYAHLSAVIVDKYQKVSAGQLIGFSGDTGSSTAPHVHFRVRERHEGKWVDVDPEEYL
jgi:murein DD-endopeptidase MepM/ murein hydrolase activator NlpD